MNENWSLIAMCFTVGIEWADANKSILESDCVDYITL